LDDYIGKKNLVIYFYPKDESSGCAREACAFRDSYSAFRELDAEVLGISSDIIDSHGRFAKDRELPFSLLSDSDGSVRRVYGVKPTLGFIPGRTTFIVEKQGIVRHIFTPQIRPERHVEEALKALESIT